MKIMTQNADVLSEQKHILSLAHELTDRNISLLALKNSTQESAEELAGALHGLGVRCTLNWISDQWTGEDGGNGTALLCLGRGIRCADRFSLTKGTGTRKCSANMVFGIQIEGMEDWFYCISQDPSDLFYEQWKQLNSCIVGKRLCSAVWLLGMKRYRKSVCPANWVEAADGDVWCSRDQIIRCYRLTNSDQASCSEKGAVIIEVKE